MESLSRESKFSCDRPNSTERAMPELVNAWRRRVGIEHLGVGYELWDLVRPKASVHDRLVARMSALGRDYENKNIAYDVVQFLLAEVLNAEKGIERAYEAALPT